MSTYASILAGAVEFCFLKGTFKGTINCLEINYLEKIMLNTIFTFPNKFQMLNVVEEKKI